MPSGIELVLGWEYPEENPVMVFPTQEQINAEEGDLEFVNEMVADWNKKNRDKLDAAQEEGFSELGFKKVNKKKSDYKFYETPNGVQEFCVLELEYYMDPYEMGEDAEMALLGISVSSRYFPNFVDWNGFLWNIKLEENLERRIIREQICKQFPEFQTASYYIKQRWY